MKLIGLEACSQDGIFLTAMSSDHMNCSTSLSWALTKVVSHEDLIFEVPLPLSDTNTRTHTRASIIEGSLLVAYFSMTKLPPTREQSLVVDFLSDFDPYPVYGFKISTLKCP